MASRSLTILMANRCMNLTDHISIAEKLQTSDYVCIFYCSSICISITFLRTSITDYGTYNFLYIHIYTQNFLH